MTKKNGHKDNVLIVIPARLDSFRLPEKLLEDIHGKPVIYWVAKRMQMYQRCDFIVSTDSRKIAMVCEEYQFPYVMTSSKCRNGTERVHETVNKLGEYSHFINVQGDEPLVNLELLDRMIETIGHNESAFKTAVSEITFDINNDSEIKVAMQGNGRIRYASRSAVPYNRDSTFLTYKIHGVYLYTLDVLEKFVQAPEGNLEKIEKVEQLRCIENDIELFGVTCPGTPKSIDTFDDLLVYREVPLDKFENPYL